MKKFNWFDGAALLIPLLPDVYLISIYSSLPARVPMHYDIHGNVDRYGSTGELVGLVIFLTLLSFGLYVLMRFLPAIDPKRKAQMGEENYNKLAMGIIIFMAATNIFIMYSALHPGSRAKDMVLPGISLLLAFMGNVMYNIKPNYFAGLRTPWALENEDTWRATHRLAGKLWFGCGLALAIITLLLPSEPATIIFLATTFAICIIPAVYSYLYFKKHTVR